LRLGFFRCVVPRVASDPPTQWKHQPALLNTRLLSRFAAIAASTLGDSWRKNRRCCLVRNETAGSAHPCAKGSASRGRPRRHQRVRGVNRFDGDVVVDRIRRRQGLSLRRGNSRSSVAQPENIPAVSLTLSRCQLVTESPEVAWHLKCNVRRRVPSPHHAVSRTDVAPALTTGICGFPLDGRPTDSRTL
jgi:hypothetical protein